MYYAGVLRSSSTLPLGARTVPYDLSPFFHTAMSRVPGDHLSRDHLSLNGSAKQRDGARGPV